MSNRRWGRGQAGRIGRRRGILLLVGTLFAPWPVRDDIDTRAAWFRDTGSRLALSRGKSSSGPLVAGVARIDLTPAVPVPLAGFVGQIARPYEGINSRCSATALTLAGPGGDVTILAADLLLVDDRLARAVVRRTGLARDRIYFTATHTHSGPGGWGLHPLERLVAGTYRPDAFAELVGRLADVVLESRSRVRPAEVAFVQAQAEGLQRNRIAPGPTNARLSAWVFRAAGGEPGRAPIATFVTFGAHATLVHPASPRLGGDYPGALAAVLPSLCNSGTVLFAAGTVGDSAPARVEAPNQQRAAEIYARSLADLLARRVATAEFRRTVDFGVLGLEVDLPPVQIPCFGARLRFSPLLSWWVAPRRTYLHAVRLGPATLVGFPGDYAGHLARSLDEGSTPVVATSFNGDYKGYLVSAETFRAYSCYETRWMNFFGPTSGDYLTGLARQCAIRLDTPTP